MAPHWAKLALPVALTLAAFIVGSQAQQQPRDSLYEEYGEAVEAEEETGAVGDAPAPHSEFHLKPADNHLINRTKKGSLLLVSTLDGTLSALDVDDNGRMLWALKSSTFLSSSISKVEMRSHGQWVRLIPSLDGSLYKFDGESIDPLAVSADSLLQSSFQMSDDLLITGSKEVSTYGVDAYTGLVRYECTKDGCRGEPASASSASAAPMLVVRRLAKTVRAIEPRTGMERWNFSVGQHEATLLHASPSAFSECHDEDLNTDEQMDCLLKESLASSEDNQIVSVATEAAPIDSSVRFRVDVPEGSVYAMHRLATDVLWKFQFDSPVVNAWHLVDDQLVPLNLFRLASYAEEQQKTMDTAHLYVGIHKQQIYVQQSQRMADLVHQSMLEMQNESNQKSVTVFRVPWNPLATTSLEHYQPGIRPDEDDQMTALIVRHETEYPFERGFYLLDGPATNESRPAPADAADAADAPAQVVQDETVWNEGDDITIEKVIVYYVAPLWVWWREVFLISFVTAVLFHVMITREIVHVLRENFSLELQRHIRALVPARLAIADRQPSTAVDIREMEPLEGEPPAEPVAESKIDIVLTEPSKTASASSAATDASVSTPPAYVSRYLTDFEPVQCLGRGGFGVVFETRNLLDDCHYAVKRIQLPNSQEARDKVMREVKALAKLDNPHIVRYFHAWIECPPPGWQEHQDAQWLHLQTGITSNGAVSLTEDDDAGASSRQSGGGGAAVDFSFSLEDELAAPSRRRNAAAAAAASRCSAVSDGSSFDVVFEHSHCTGQSERSCPEMDDEDDESSSEFGDFSSNSNNNNNNSNNNNNNSSSSSSSDASDGSWGDESAAFDSTPAVGGSRRPPQQQQQQQQQKQQQQQLLLQPVRPPEAKMFLYIQMQLCRKESLREWLRAHATHRDPYQVLHMFNEIISAVEYVHLQGLIHRDLKPSNIFFAPDGAIKIGDFGLVTAMTEESAFVNSPCHDAGAGAFPPFHRHTDQVGTQLYMSPEQIQGKPYNHKVDIYSLGLIFFELLWPLNTQMEQVTVISQLRKSRFPAGFSEKYPQEEILLRETLSKNPDKRPTTIGIRRKPPLNSFQDESIFDIPEYQLYHLQRPRSTSFRTLSSGSTS